jgi:hypothetical protein
MSAQRPDDEPFVDPVDRDLHLGLAQRHAGAAGVAGEVLEDERFAQRVMARHRDELHAGSRRRSYLVAAALVLGLGVTAWVASLSSGSDPRENRASGAADRGAGARVAAGPTERAPQDPQVLRVAVSVREPGRAVPRGGVEADPTRPASDWEGRVLEWRVGDAEAVTAAARMVEQVETVQAEQKQRAAAVGAEPADARPVRIAPAANAQWGDVIQTIEALIAQTHVDLEGVPPMALVPMFASGDGQNAAILAPSAVFAIPEGEREGPVLDVVQTGRVFVGRVEFPRRDRAPDAAKPAPDDSELVAALEHARGVAEMALRKAERIRRSAGPTPAAPGARAVGATTDAAARPSVLLRIDRGAPWADARRVLVACAGAGFELVHLAVVRAQPDAEKGRK